ncbi:hypothetical protein PHAVU_001G041100 [Phaseolus vulgaris]|uniref:Glutathione peroxidase n=2 Tax=Phaseolus vulgaris TaxID=3885 RepID=V7CUL5_PHAVU|nr:hypothetical protein PHAVU_001G041100g [Phaseolus vulgaris]ESW33073.1 hypothetical protein PHAVU_001G041100g [Phaseolus vulgaris]
MRHNLSSIFQLKKGSNLRTLFTSQSPKMSSMAFSTTFFTSLHDFTHTRTNPPNSPSFPFIKSSLASSNSTFFHPTLSLQTLSTFPRFIKPRSFSVHARAATEKTIYDFTVKDIDRKDVPLNKFKGKVLLIVNVASRCGLTSSNYSELSRLYEKYKNQGLEVLAFPCNQFGMQEPGSNEEIKQFACTRYKAEFPIFDKVDVNGPFTAPVYQFLKSSAGGFLGDLIKWNFEKFLVDKNGKVIERYPPTTSPFQIEKDIQRLLAA